jgi:ribosomal protein S18 acetylase RimI-like enzyme
LYKQVFSEEDWTAVQDFDCGDSEDALEVSTWLKAPRDQDGALAMSLAGGDVWVYRRSDTDEIVGFGALGASTWSWTRNSDPKIEVTVLLWFGVAKRFQRQPEGADAPNRYAGLILRDLEAEAKKTSKTHPVIGLLVRETNAKAIRLYEHLKYSSDTLKPRKDPETQVVYIRMAKVLDPDALREILASRQGAKKKK